MENIRDEFPLKVHLEHCIRTVAGCWPAHCRKRLVECGFGDLAAAGVARLLVASLASKFRRNAFLVITRWFLGRDQKFWPILSLSLAPAAMNLEHLIQMVVAQAAKPCSCESPGECPTACLRPQGTQSAPNLNWGEGGSLVRFGQDDGVDGLHWSAVASNFDLGLYLGCASF